jgi:hypothetical protein
MDISANVYDLQFLTNPNLINKISNEKRLGISPEDIKFYKKRIFVLTKNYLKGKKKDRDLDKIWEEYASACIAHFKFIDKAEIIQEDYKEYKTKKKNTKIDKNVIKNSNEFMLNKKSPHAPRITDHINVKSTKIKTAKKMIIPQQRNINIKTDKFKNKI